VTVENPGKNQSGDRLEKLNSRRLFGEAGSDRDRRIASAPVMIIDRSSLDQDCEMKADRYAELFC